MNINTNINTTLVCTIAGILMNQIHISEIYKVYWIDRETMIRPKSVIKMIQMDKFIRSVFS